MRQMIIFQEQRSLSDPLKPLLLGKDKSANEPEMELRKKLGVKRAMCWGTSEATMWGGAHHGKTQTFQLEDGLQNAEDISNRAGPAN